MRLLTSWHHVYSLCEVMVLRLEARATNTLYKSFNTELHCQLNNFFSPTVWKLLYMYLWFVNTHTQWDTKKWGQRTTCRSLFFPFTFWVLGLNLGYQAGRQEPFLAKPSCPASWQLLNPAITVDTVFSLPNDFKYPSIYLLVTEYFLCKNIFSVLLSIFNWLVMFLLNWKCSSRDSFNARITSKRFQSSFSSSQWNRSCLNMPWESYTNFVGLWRFVDLH